MSHEVWDDSEGNPGTLPFECHDCGHAQYKVMEIRRNERWCHLCFDCLGDASLEALDHDTRANALANGEEWPPVEVVAPVLPAERGGPWRVVRLTERMHGLLVSMLAGAGEDYEGLPRAQEDVRKLLRIVRSAKRDSETP